MELTGPDRKLAKEIFGRPARVLLAAWVLQRDGQIFFQLEALDALARPGGEARSAIVHELDRFVDLGLLQRVPSERKVWYQPLDSPLWAIFLAAKAVFRLSEDHATTGSGR